MKLFAFHCAEGENAAVRAAGLWKTIGAAESRAALCEWVGDAASGPHYATPQGRADAPT